MPKGPKITPDVKRLIAEVHDEYPDKIGKEVAAEVQARLKQIKPDVMPDWPGLSIVQIELKKLREYDGPQRNDGLWCMGKLAEYDIPPEAIPKILAIQELKITHKPLTIREAQWAGRLYAVIQGVMELAIGCTIYAERERICEKAGIEKDTSDIDVGIHSGFVTVPSFFPWLFRQDWIPDSSKEQISEDVTRQVEHSLGLEAERPTLTTIGWLVYADWLQYSLRPDKKNDREFPSVFKMYGVLHARLQAMNEGKILWGSDSFVDEVEIWKADDYSSKPIGSNKKLLEYIENEPQIVTEEIRKFNNPEFVEFLVQLRDSGLGYLSYVRKHLGLDKFDQNGIFFDQDVSNVIVTEEDEEFEGHFYKDILEEDLEGGSYER